MPDALIHIRSEAVSAEIDPQGAQLFALRDLMGGDADGADLLWDGDPAVWTGRAPVLFPIVGGLVDGRYRLGDREFSLPKHGFARHRLFEVAESAPDRAVLRLRWDEETLAVYPFRFELDLAFALTGASLTMTATVRNLDQAAPMPASFGFHPALRWPLPYGQPRADHALVFEHDEPAPIRRVGADGLVLPDAVPTPVEGATLVLRDGLFTNDAVIFDQFTSRRLTYGAGAGPQIEVAFPDTDLLGVWTKPGAGYVCIEPWHGWADPAGYSGDFWDKPGVFTVEPGGERAMVMSITLRTRNPA